MLARALAFKAAIRDNRQEISDALDAIPPAVEPVTKADYMRFVRLFRGAFPNGGGGLATGTRLLAMKRPDVFVCLDRKNRGNLCSRTRSRLENMVRARGVTQAPAVGAPMSALP